MKMRSRKKYFPLSQKGIKDAIDYLEQYKKQLLEKTQQFLEVLSEYGIKEADKRFDAAKTPGTDTSHAVIKSASFDNDKVRLNIQISGGDLIFIEFGAGVHFNSSSKTHTNAGENVHQWDKMRAKYPDYRIGKYGTGDEWQWSLGIYDSWHVNGQIVYGTKATMPVYGAWLAMSDVRNIKAAAEEVFGDWS